MYTRSYTGEANAPTVLPENYSGVAFSELNNAKNPDTGETSPEITEHSEAGHEAVSGGVFSPAREGGFFGKLFPGGLSSLGISFPKIGGEEILIIATAMFLFFSADGDREFALILLLLLLIN